MSLKLISKYRGCLMAISMIWLSFNHSYYPIGNKLFRFFLVICGYLGADLFLFISGFGIYFSLKKEPQFTQYIRRRINRILPYSMLYYLVLKILEGRTWVDTLIDTFGLSFFIRGDISNWFVSIILILYMMAPFYYKIFRKKPDIITAISIAFLYAVCLCVGNNLFTYYFFRFSLFALGMYFAYLSEKEVKPVFMYAILFISVLGWVLMYVSYHVFGSSAHVFPSVLIAPGMLLFISYVMDKANFLNHFLSFVGKYTFQFYLVHVKVLNFIYGFYGVLYVSGIGFDWWINVAGVITSFAIAVAMKAVVDLFEKSVRIIKNIAI